MPIDMEKDENAVKDLLRKYYEAETSLEEDSVLEEYFVNHPEACAEHGWFTGRHIFKQERASTILQSKVVLAIETQRTRQWHLGIAATLVFALAAFLVYFTFSPFSAKVITIASGSSQKNITLPDGSHVTLNTNTTFAYPEVFKEGRREVWLNSGEAFFDVVENPRVPFVVFTETTSTEVVGTSFNIRAVNPARTEVNVITGTVYFNASKSRQKEKIALHAGKSGAFHNREQRMEKFDSDPNSIAWMTRQLEFKDAPLIDVFNTVENYFGVSIHTPDSSILSCRFRGSFKDAKLAEIFEVISFSLDLTFSKVGKNYTVSGKGCK